MQEEWGKIAPVSRTICAGGKIRGYVSGVQAWEEIRVALLAAKRRGDQKRIALRLGVDESTVTRFLQGKLEPPFDAVRVMTEVVGIDICDVRTELPPGLSERISAAVADVLAPKREPLPSPKRVSRS